MEPKTWHVCDVEQQLADNTQTSPAEHKQQATNSQQQPPTTNNNQQQPTTTTTTTTTTATATTTTNNHDYSRNHNHNHNATATTTTTTSTSTSTTRTTVIIWHNITQQQAQLELLGLHLADETQRQRAIQPPNPAAQPTRHGIEYQLLTKDFSQQTTVAQPSLTKDFSQQIDESSISMCDELRHDNHKPIMDNHELSSRLRAADVEVQDQARSITELSNRYQVVDPIVGLVVSQFDVFGEPMVQATLRKSDTLRQLAEDAQQHERLAKQVPIKKSY